MWTKADKGGRTLTVKSRPSAGRVVRLRSVGVTLQER